MNDSTLTIACMCCGVEKPHTVEFFDRTPTKVIGRKCKECRKAYMRQRYKEDPERYKQQVNEYRLKNPEKVRETNRKAATRNRTRPERQAYLKNWIADNREKLSADKKLRYRKNRQHHLSLTQQWAHANPERVKQIKDAYKARHPERDRASRKASAARRRVYLIETGTYTPDEWRAKLASYKGKCHWCGEKIKGTPHADHVIAVSRGGKGTIDNVVPSCSACNLRKYNKMPWEFSGRLL